MAESAVAFLLNNITIWLQEERMLLGGLRDEALIIRGEFQQIRAFLRVADSQEEANPQLKEWVRQVREIAYDIEDVLESYLLRRGASNGGHIKELSASIKNLKAKHTLASQIKALRSRAESASKTFKELYAVLPGSSSNAVAWYDGRDDALLLAEADTVGIEMPKKQLLEWISTADYVLKVISVVGMVGLGKTTLAKRVYDDPTVKENFAHRVWITVSETFRLENLLRDLIKQLLQGAKQAVPPELETMNAASMREFVQNFLHNKRYMIILDDVWTTNVWEALRYAFPKRNMHGRGCIIITTRLKDIGEAACCETGGHVYHLQPLPPQQAEQLFHKKAFPNGSCPDYLKEISRNILRRCGGLPLAIVVIGGTLATKRNEIQEWAKFSLSSESEVEGDDLKRMWKLLSLSYYDLPYFLKACLLYLSIFPEDVFIEKATIIRLWIAEGFVKAKQDETEEETAEGYLNQLFNRSLIQLAKTSRDGRPRNFQIHDLVREYIISKAKEQNIVAMKSGRETTRVDQIRRISLDDNRICSNEKTNKLKCLRTLVSFASVDLKLGTMICKVLNCGCRMLKVLDLRGAALDAIPDEVFRLYHLKYLSLRYTNVSFIPKLIGNLIKLEILDLKGCKVVELPAEILKLGKLQYLLVYRYEVEGFYFQFDNIQSFEAPSKIGHLLCLKKLCFIDATASIVREIGKLTELRRLGIAKLRKEDGKELCSSLANLTYLTSLSISSVEEAEIIDMEYSMPPCLQFLRSLVLRGRLEKPPLWIPCLKALTDLCLRWSRMGEDPLEYLQGLPNLLILNIQCAYDGEELSFKRGGFRRLKKLFLSSMSGVRRIRVEEGCLPLLTRLLVQDCKLIRELPMGIEHLSLVNTVQFIDMAETFKEKLLTERRRGGHQWKKIAHIPNIHIGILVDGEFKYLRL